MPIAVHKPRQLAKEESKTRDHITPKLILSTFLVNEISSTYLVIYAESQGERRRDRNTPPPPPIHQQLGQN